MIKKMANKIAIRNAALFLGLAICLKNSQVLELFTPCWVLNAVLRY
jgi:hypothetical protein